jgi:DNA gyrase inhibitor GyrI
VNTVIEIMPSYRIAYIRKVGPYGAANVQAMEELKGWAKENGLLNEKSIVFGIARDNPETTEPQSCRYDTCIVLSDDYAVSSDTVRQGNIDGGKYAVFQIDHTAEAVQQAWAGIFPELSKRRCQFDDARPIIKRYKAGLVRMHIAKYAFPSVEAIPSTNEFFF